VFLSVLPLAVRGVVLWHHMFDELVEINSPAFILVVHVEQGSKLFLCEWQPKLPQKRSAEIVICQAINGASKYRVRLLEQVLARLTAFRNFISNDFLHVRRGPFPTFAQGCWKFIHWGELGTKPCARSTARSGSGGGCVNVALRSPQIGGEVRLLGR